jgi:hypothetical protein
LFYLLLQTSNLPVCGK